MPTMYKERNVARYPSKNTPKITSDAPLHSSSTTRKREDLRNGLFGHRHDRPVRVSYGQRGHDASVVDELWARQSATQL